MKRNVVFIVLLAGMFIASQALAQNETPTKESNKTTVKKTEVKSSTGTETKTTGKEANVKQTTTPPPVKSSKEPPTSGKQTQSGSSSKSSKKAGSGQPGTISAAGTSAPAPKMIYDAQGNVIYKIDATGGWIRDPKNRLVGQYADGEYHSKNRVKAGSVDNGIVRDKNGKEFARINPDGKVQTAAGQLMGTIAEDGTITDENGKKIGSAPGVDKNIAALVFFLKPSSLNAAGNATNKKR